MQAHVGEVIAWRNLFWSLSEAMVRDPSRGSTTTCCRTEPRNAYQVIATIAYTEGEVHHRADVRFGAHLPQLACDRLQELGDQALSRSLSARLEWLRRRTAREAHEAAVGLDRHEFGGRHELYEINYWGSTEEIRRYALFGAMASGAPIA